ETRACACTDRTLRGQTFPRGLRNPRGWPTVLDKDFPLFLRPSPAQGVQPLAETEEIGKFSRGELMPKSSTARNFSREFKLSAVRRMLAGENVSALARELAVLRKDLYVWRDRFRAPASSRPRRSTSSSSHEGGLAQVGPQV